MGLYEDNQLRLDGRYELLQCKDCDFTYLNLNPNSKDLKDFYPPNYLPHQTDYPLKYYHLETLKLLPPQTGRVLDIGCGNGVFLREMQKRGWQIIGLETNHQAAQVCQEMFGIERIFEGPLEKFSLSKESFNLVTFFHVLEHLPDPTQDLKKCFTLLRPGGTLVVNVPNASSLEAKLFWPNWYGLDIPRHLSQFRKTDLLKIIEKTGFEKKLTLKTIGHFLSKEHQGWIKHSIDIFYAKERKQIESNTHNRLIHYLKRSWLKLKYQTLIILGFFLHYLQKITDNNGEMLLVAKRQD